MIHLVTPPQQFPDQSQTSAIDDDLTVDDQTLVTMAFRMSILEQNFSNIASGFNTMISTLQSSLSNNNATPETPAPREGTGVSS